MQCPVDGTTLAMTERQSVEIDYCPECRGIWLDRGELDRIIEHANAGLAHNGYTGGDVDRHEPRRGNDDRYEPRTRGGDDENGERHNRSGRKGRFASWEVEHLARPGPLVVSLLIAWGLAGTEHPHAARGFSKGGLLGGGVAAASVFYG